MNKRNELILKKLMPANFYEEQSYSKTTAATKLAKKY